MATKLIVALACFALCNSSPVILRGYYYRDGRGYSVGQGYTNSAGGRATGSATINGGVVQAYGTATSDDQNQMGKNIGYGPYPGQAVAKAEVYDTPAGQGSANAVAEALNTPTFYAVPAPATVVSYQQNFETPTEIKYPGNIAESSAILNENSEAITSTRTVGAGSAQANTQGVGSYGITSSNTKTFGSGFGSAYSVNNGNGATSTSAKTQGYGSASSKTQNGLGLTFADTQTNGGYASSSANNALDSTIVSANSQGYGSASSKTDVVNNVIVPTKFTDLKGIHWQFGTAYNVPTPGKVQVSSQANGGSAKSTAHTNDAITTADAQGYGQANANVNSNGGYVNSAANTNGIGYGAAKYIAGNGFGSANSAISNGLGNIKSSANSNGYGNANANADINELGSMTSNANSNGYGSASSSVNSAPQFATLRNDGLPHFYSGPRTSVNTQTSGQGSASSSARTQGLNTGYRVINSAANSFGHGTAQANASA